MAKRMTRKAAGTKVRARASSRRKPKASVRGATSPLSALSRGGKASSRAAPAPGRDFLTVNDFSAAELGAALDLAARCKATPGIFANALRERNVILVFEKPSLRTRVSFEVGVQSLGGRTLFFPQTDSRLGERESIHDFAKVLERMVDAIVARVYSQEALLQLAAHASIPIVNALSDAHHPCQAVADLLTIREAFGALQGLRVCYVGDGNNVTHSLMQAGALAGMHVTALCPEDRRPDAAISVEADRTARENGGSVRVTSEIGSVSAQHAVYTDTWTSMHHAAGSGGEDRNASLRPYRVDQALFSRLARKDGILLHCLPAHRGEEVAADVIDGPASRIFDQAENRMWAQNAIMMLLLPKARAR
ncbi:ornithine carbamoyltransferase [soil metagenome]